MEEAIAIDWTLGDIVKLYFVNIDFKSGKYAKEYPELSHSTSKKVSGKLYFKHVMLQGPSGVERANLK